MPTLLALAHVPVLVHLAFQHSPVRQLMPVAPLSNGMHWHQHLAVQGGQPWQHQQREEATLQGQQLMTPVAWRPTSPSLNPGPFHSPSRSPSPSLAAGPANSVAAPAAPAAVPAAPASGPPCPVPLGRPAATKQQARRGGHAEVAAGAHSPAAVLPGHSRWLLQQHS